MIRSLRATLALVLALALASVATAQPQAKLAVGQWAQERSDVAADPSIRFGALPNGLRYAIRRQAIPPGQAALRLRIDAGSLMEADDQRGLAHFLEHMAFNGSTGVKEGEMVKILERLGLSFGADTNASTGFSETIYKLDLPRTDAETVDTSLMLLREAASNLSLDPAAVERERGVVLSEERARDTPGYRVYQDRLAFLLPGQRLTTRYPIGKVEVLKSAPASQFARFYADYYRPERAVIVAVGDFDPAQMEAKIKARFSDWTAAGPGGVDPDEGTPASRSTEARLVVEPGAPASLQLAWVGPADLAPYTAAKRRADLTRYLGFAILNRRYSAMARAPAAPFLGASAFRSNQERSAAVTMVSVSPDPARWREALQAAEQEARRAIRHGVRQDELDREITEITASLKAAAAGAATRRPADLAGDILNAVANDEVVTSPQQDLAFFQSAMSGMTAASVSQALKDAFQGAGPLLFMSSPTPIEGAEQTLLAALAASQAVAVIPSAAPAALTWPYESFGAPGTVTESRTLTDLQTTMIRFKNGVRLTVRPTTFRDDEVMVRVNVGDGLLGLSPDQQSPAWASGAVIEGGLKRIGPEDMERVLASRVYGARFGLGDDAITLAGNTRPEDLAVQLQVLTAYVTEPGWRPQAFERLKTAGRTIHDQYDATPGGVLARDLASLMRSGDRRWSFPSRQEIAQGQLAALQAQVTPALANGAIEVVIVGDVTVAAATEAVARSLGALPPRPERVLTPPEQRRLSFPPGLTQPKRLEHKGRADQGLAFMAWPTTDFFANPQAARETSVMGEILSLRLLEELRETQGVTYSPSAGAAHSLVWTGFGYISASVEAPPEKLAGFFADVDKIAADLRAKEVPADELLRAKAPRIERLQKARLTNGFWLQELSGAQADPRRLANIREALAGMEQVSAADVRRAAERWLDPAKAWRLEVRPAGS